MPKAKSTRKQLFRAALSIAGMTMRQWAEKHGVTDSHVAHVLAGDRESISLTAKMDEFIDKHLISKNALVA